MTGRRIVFGALSTIVFLAATAVGGDAFAARKKPVNPGPCVIVQRPMCPAFQYPACVRPTSCGGCLKWACKPWLTR